MARQGSGVAFQRFGLSWFSKAWVLSGLSYLARGLAWPCMAFQGSGLA